MYLSEQYLMYRTAYLLVKNHHFEVLHINNQEEEIWLEKFENKTSHIVRLVHNGFSWTNHLKKDIALVFQKTKAMVRYLQGKHIEIHNVYVSSHAPVDDWELLKKPLQLNEKNPIKMNVYYLEENEIENERSRLFKSLDFSATTDSENITDSEKEQKIIEYKNELGNNFYHKQKEAETVFSFGKPFLTYLLLLINIVMFIMLEMKAGGSQSTENLVNFGAKYNPAIIDGEWWRIITSMFLHIGLLHLFMNMLAVYYLGNTSERIYGSWRFLVIYFLAGIGGGLASFAFTFNVSAGASGALFGLFGALLYFGLLYKKIFLQTMGKGLLILIGINIVFGFSFPQIDNGAHIGGLITGFVASAIVGLPKKRKMFTQICAFVLYVLITGGLIIFGVHNNINSANYQLVKIDELLQQENYEGVVERATKGLEHPEELEAQLLFQRSYAYIELNKTNLAIEDLEHVVEIKNDMPEAYYNLAILYSNRGDKQLAKEAVEKAYQLKPNDDEYIRFYEQITGEKPKS
ncbi:rhomboid family intramembrane serine protease [Virgibacillus ndiopensis]|uniref:rhomboid family intramembrane serine protease n=1 Tax=Virgibacillus ndiopensis TaxID=2004408 RepID=UPI000C07FE9B|nr:rhomboid family intramembrane serine protease [Virgibacillus ndiopensis]